MLSSVGGSWIHDFRTVDPEFGEVSGERDARKAGTAARFVDPIVELLVRVLLLSLLSAGFCSIRSDDAKTTSQPTVPGSDMWKSEQ